MNMACQHVLPHSAASFKGIDTLRTFVLKYVNAMRILDVLSVFDWIDRLEGLISTIANADWRSAHQRDGAKGVMSESFSTLTYHNAPMIRVSRFSSWSGLAIERLLHRHGVKIWDRGVTSQELFFRVKRRQVKWAEYLLLRAGVPIIGVLVEPRNTDWAAGYPPGSEPPNWSQ